MDHVMVLRRQAAALRDVAGRSTHPDLSQRMIELAIQCEELADSFAQAPSEIRPGAG